jgi:hypothetical protein
MNLKRALTIGVVLWVVFFFEVSILMFGFGLAAGTTYYIIHYSLSAIFLTLASLIYFKEKGSIKEGLHLGLVFALVGIVLDAVITVPLFVKNYSNFFTIYMLMGYLEGVIVATIVGGLKAKKK